MKNPEAIMITGEINMLCTPSTIGELREFMKMLDSYQLSDETEIQEGYIDFSVSGPASQIQCGCAIPGSKTDWYVDALVQLHDCEED